MTFKELVNNRWFNYMMWLLTAMLMFLYTAGSILKCMEGKSYIIYSAIAVFYWLLSCYYFKWWYNNE